IAAERYELALIGRANTLCLVAGPGEIALQLGGISPRIEVVEVPFRHGPEGGFASAHERSPESGCRLGCQHWCIARHWHGTVLVAVPLIRKRLTRESGCISSASSGPQDDWHMSRQKKFKSDRLATIHLPQ